ncbi:MAG TPA: Lrp/AsnC ligand binding domain-containing protein [Nitrososphaeraceae archaeon]|jgi:DNA-binding Lrp family transcriptional regulator|nr:Lrp/AsnC ligand binding domain-containing protein [Nitrososphaeraceae archaeon]
MSMVNAYVLICCDLAASEKVVEELEKIDGVQEVSPVSGVYDIIARISASTEDELKSIYMEIRKMKKVLTTITLIVSKTL